MMDPDPDLTQHRIIRVGHLTFRKTKEKTSKICTISQILNKYGFRALDPESLPESISAVQ